MNNVSMSCHTRQFSECCPPNLIPVRTLFFVLLWWNTYCLLWKQILPHTILTPCEQWVGSRNKFNVLFCTISHVEPRDKAETQLVRQPQHPTQANRRRNTNCVHITCYHSPNWGRVEWEIAFVYWVGSIVYIPLEGWKKAPLGCWKFVLKLIALENIRFAHCMPVQQPVNHSVAKQDPVIFRRHTMSIVRNK